MNAQIKQFFYSCIFAFLSVVFERVSGSLVASEFVTENGLIVIFALFAINIATLAAILPMLRSLEESRSQAGYFQQTRAAALNGVKEMLIMCIIFYILMSLAPHKYWSLNSDDNTYCQVIISYIVCTTSRACIFQTVYATYDFSRMLVKLSAQK